MLIDQKSRELATNPTQSFIVQAPAGSGKTEILTQRYLRLLSTVQAPEQIVALTFTRKAANEMRERILLALQQSTQKQQAVSSHQQRTLDYATSVLKHDTKYNWQLLEQPHRLKIMTIDALCQMLVHAIPAQNISLHRAEVYENPQELYQNAAYACLQYALKEESYQPALTTLLEHLDNQQSQLLSLWTDLLARRTEWLSLIYPACQQDQTKYEYALRCIERHALERLQEALPLELHDELATLLNQLIQCVGASEATPTMPSSRGSSVGSTGLPESPDLAKEARSLGARLESEKLDPLYDLPLLGTLNHQQIKRLTHLLLTSQNTLRKGFDHHVGLRRDACRKEDYDCIKAHSKTLLAALAELPDFLPALLRVKNLPEPYYHPEQWKMLQALFALLPLLVAHLNVIFQKQQCVDFTAIAQHALEALGDELQPTDLTLYLDNQIQHILVDEFQDTSLQQFQLLEQLMQGWQSGDGRTLFLVGDPMQSIYRFRHAEVGLFLRTREQGLGVVQLIPLELCCNFRSTETIVDWINLQFKNIFPAYHDIESGAVAFHASVAQPSQAPATSTYIQAIQCQNPSEEAEALLQSIQFELNHFPEDTIAVLVRSRHQLKTMIRVLRQHHIPFQGVDIDLLANLPHIRDVWSLTQALLMPAHRLAWLALLRSPYCGLSLADLHSIANHAKSQSIYFSLMQLDTITELSKEGRQRAHYVAMILHQALLERYQYTLVDWLIRTLKALHINEILNPQQQSDLEQYWQLLDQFDRSGQIENLALFKQTLAKLYSKQVTPSRLQIMTIHKSKGLEFDCVILPGLGNKSKPPHTPLLRWLQLPTEQGELLLVSPMKAAHHEQCRIYDYLGKLDAEKNDYEAQRLFYVATTRAKKRLYLFDNDQKPHHGSFRHFLPHQTFGPYSSQIKNNVESTQIHAPLWHLPVEKYQTIHYHPPLSAANPMIRQTNNARVIGIVAHELLQWICDHHPTQTSQVPWTLATRRLREYGLADEALQTGENILQQQINHFFQDPQAQWIMLAREDERNEYAVLTQIENEITTRIIDRTFSEQGTRWIIDFKTGREHDEQASQHRQQLNEYAKLLEERFAQPIQCGLYYLASGQWLTWSFA